MAKRKAKHRTVSKQTAHFVATPEQIAQMERSSVAVRERERKERERDDELRAKVPYDVATELDWLVASLKRDWKQKLEWVEQARRLDHEREGQHGPSSPSPSSPPTPKSRGKPPDAVLAALLDHLPKGGVHPGGELITMEERVRWLAQRGYPRNRSTVSKYISEYQPR